MPCVMSSPSSTEARNAAASALSEFAPENRFYANQRRVQIDQINMKLAETEEWRLCPSCHHVEKMLGQQLQQACPRCGTPGWSDVEQKRTLLRFRQAIANANEERTRIDDRSDDRDTPASTGRSRSRRAQNEWMVPAKNRSRLPSAS